MRKTMLLKSLFAGLALVAFSPVFAVKPQIAGRLVDRTGEAVGYACLHLVAQRDSLPVDATVSAADGRFAIEATDTPVLLKISATGFEERYIADPAGEMGDIVLAEANVAIDEVVVVGREQASSLTDEGNIRFDINKLGGNLGADITDALNRLPGVTASRKEGLTLNGRSATLYIDGRKQNISSAQAVNLLKAMPAESVDNVELVGYTGSAYDASGGPVINIVTRRRKDDGWSLSLGGNATADREGNVDGGGSISVVARRGRVGIYAMADYNNGVVSYVRRDSTIGIGAGALLEHRDAYSRTNNGSAMANIEWSAAPRHTLNINLYAYKGREVSDTRESASDGVTASHGRLAGTSGDGLASATAEYAADLGGELKLKLSYGVIHLGERERGRYDDGGGVIDARFRTGGTQHIVKADLTKRFDRTQLAAGVKAEMGALRNTMAYGGDLPAWLERESGFRARENICAAYINVSHRLGDRFSINAGLRGELTDYRTENLTQGRSEGRRYADLFPSLSFTHRAKNIRQTLYLLSGIHRPDYSYLYPGRHYISERSYSVGNPQLAPQKALSVKYVGYYWDYARLAVGWQRDSDLFARMLEMEEQGVTSYVYRNYADRDYLFADVTIPFALFQRRLYGNVEVGVNYTGLINSRGEYPHNGFWNTQIKGFVQYDIGDRLSVNATFACYPRRTTAQSRQSPYWWLDMGLDWYMTRDKAWLLSLSVDDIANALEHNQVYNYSQSTLHRHTKSVTQLVRLRLTWKIGGYEASDFLWGKATNVAPTDKVIKLGFRHMMASARITLAEGTGFGSGEWAAAEKSALVLNTVRKATIDLATGEVTPTGDVPSTGTIPYVDGADYRAIVVPQEVAANTPLVSVTVDGTPYLLSKDETFTFVPSKQHNFTITVNKRESGGYEFVLSAESITAWENDTVSHDATAREYIVIDVKEAGTLEECIAAAGKEASKIKNLKVTGNINSRDFAVMKYRMTMLQALNLQETTIVAGAGGGLADCEPVGADADGWYSDNKDNEIPAAAMRYKTSLLRLVLPAKFTRVGQSAFHGCSNIVGSLIIPEGVTSIAVGAFADCQSMTGTLSLPSTLESIDGNYVTGDGGAFNGCGFTCELKLPDKLEYIGPYSFSNCQSLYGSLILPDKLTTIGECAFEHCYNLSGSLEIPAGVTKIPSRAFAFCGFNGTLKLHDGIETIGYQAFAGNPLRGELNLPKNLVVINEGVFDGCDLSGNLQIPADVAVIGSRAFANNWRLMGTLEIPKEVQSIGASAFENCWGIEGIIFEDGVETIAKNAFNMCYGIANIKCLNTTPPYVVNGAFDGVPKDNFTVEVPESAVQLYQTAVGWSDFKRISAYRNLVIRPNVATAINTSVARDMVLNADDEWIVESQPDWVTLSQTSGTGKTELKLTFAEMPQGSAPREGEVVFKLKEKEYRTRCKVTQYDYMYAEDEFITLQSATKGNGVNLVFLGDGYNAKDISEGAYLSKINEAVEHYFNIEPYKTYRDYFNVYTAIAVSAESGIGSVNTIINNRFNTTNKNDGMVLGGRHGDSDNQMIFEYACGAPTVSKDNINETLIVMLANTTDYSGICYMWNEGAAIAYCPTTDYEYPLDFRGVIQHEAGGHGFGKLGDEYIYHNSFIDTCPCTCCGHVGAVLGAKALGWYDNLSLTGKMNEVPWSHLIFHEKYRQIVDIFEGGYMHTRGVYRSEQNSCMNNDIPYYSTISREAIVKRIMKIAGEEYSFEKFVENDVMDASTVDMTRSDVPESISRGAIHRPAPVMMGKLPQLNN